MDYQAHSTIKVCEHFARFEEQGVHRIVKMIDKWIPFGVGATIRVKSVQHKYVEQFDKKIDVKNVIRRIPKKTTTRKTKSI
jgi:hypothetical protein